MSKCTAKELSVDYCPAMSKALDDHDRRSPAVIVRMFVSLRENRPERYRAVLHSGEHRKRGIILNFCPFCGQSVRLLSDVAPA